MTEPINIDGIGFLDIFDIEGSERELPNAAGKARARKDGKRGRSAFAADICEAHGGNSETPCYKFGNLPGNGRGPYKPNAVRKLRSFLVGLIKPVVLIGFVLGAIWCGKIFLPHLFTMDSFVPGSGHSDSNSVGNDNGNGNVNRDSGPNGTTGKGQPKPRPTNSIRNSGIGSPTSITFGDHWIGA